MSVKDLKVFENLQYVNKSPWKWFELIAIAVPDLFII